jgi:hypothetical protein
MPRGVADAAWAQKDRLAAIDVPQAKAAVDAAFVAGYRWIMGVSAALALLSAGVAALWIDRR